MPRASNDIRARRVDVYTDNSLTVQPGIAARSLTVYAECLEGSRWQGGPCQVSTERVENGSVVYRQSNVKGVVSLTAAQRVEVNRNRELRGEFARKRWRGGGAHARCGAGNAEGTEGRCGSVNRGSHEC